VRELRRVQGKENSARIGSHRQGASDPGGERGFGISKTLSRKALGFGVCECFLCCAGPLPWRARQVGLVVDRGPFLSEAGATRRRKNTEGLSPLYRSSSFLFFWFILFVVIPSVLFVAFPLSLLYCHLLCLNPRGRDPRLSQSRISRQGMRPAVARVSTDGASYNNWVIYLIPPPTYTPSGPMVFGASRLCYPLYRAERGLRGRSRVLQFFRQNFLEIRKCICELCVSLCDHGGRPIRRFSMFGRWDRQTKGCGGLEGAAHLVL